MDAANVMGQLNPQGAAYMQPHAMLRELRNQGYHGSKAAERVRNIYMEYFNSNVGSCTLTRQQNTTPLNQILYL